MPATARPVRRTVRIRHRHGVSDRLVVTLFPDGILSLREYRRPQDTEVLVDVGLIYSQQKILQAMRRNGG